MREKKVNKVLVRTMILFHLSGSSMQFIMYVAKSDLEGEKLKKVVIKYQNVGWHTGVING